MTLCEKRVIDSAMQVACLVFSICICYLAFLQQEVFLG